jgi:hypothetical protein
MLQWRPQPCIHFVLESQAEVLRYWLSHQIVLYCVSFVTTTQQISVQLSCYFTFYWKNVHKIAVYVEDLFPHKISVPCIEGVSITSIWDIYTAAMIILLLEDNCKVCDGVACSGIISVPSLIKIGKFIWRLWGTGSHADIFVYCFKRKWVQNNPYVCIFLTFSHWDCSLRCRTNVLITASNSASKIWGKIWC